MKKISVFLLILCIVLLINSHNVFSVGASPARVVIPSSDEGIDIVIPYTIRNNAVKDLNIAVSVEGVLKEYVTLSKDYFFVKQGGTSSFELHLKIPKEVSFVGPQKTLIFIKEEAVEGQGIGAKTGVVPDIIVNYPYPGKYLEIQGFSVKNINLGEDTNVKWTVVSRGSEITSYYGTFSVYNDEGTKIYSREYSARTLSPGEQFSLEELVPTKKFEAGVYNSTLNIFFERNQVQSDATFRVGTEDINLLWYTKNLTVGEISPFKVGIENLWNGQFNVFARINLQGILITTPTLRIDSFGVLVLEQYINPGALVAGNYSGTIELFYGENNKQFPITVEILEPPKPGMNFESLLLPIAITLVVLVLILVLVLVLKKKKK